MLGLEKASLNMFCKPVKKRSFVSIYYKPSLFNVHIMILIVHIFMNVNKLCLNQETKYSSSNWANHVRGTKSLSELD